MGTGTAPVLLLEDVGLVPVEFINNIAVGHGVTLEEFEHVAVVFGRFSHALSVHNCVGVVEVGGVYMGMVLLVGDKPAGDVLASVVAPEVLFALKDLLLGLRARHYTNVLRLLWRGDGDLCCQTRERCCDTKARRGES